MATTLAVYLQENRSRARTAKRLIVHPNTVSYRVNQAEQILGRSIDTDVLSCRWRSRCYRRCRGWRTSTAGL